MAHNSETDDSNGLDENNSIEFHSDDANSDVFFGEDDEYQPKPTDQTNSISIINRKSPVRPNNAQQSIQTLLSSLPPIPKPTENPDPSIPGIPVIESSSNLLNNTQLSSLHFPSLNLDTNPNEERPLAESPRRLLTVRPTTTDTQPQNSLPPLPQESSVQEKSSTIKVSITPKFLLKSSLQQKPKTPNQPQAQVTFNPEQTNRQIVIPNIEKKDTINPLPIKAPEQSPIRVQFNDQSNVEMTLVQPQYPQPAKFLIQQPEIIPQPHIQLPQETERIATLFENRLDLSLTALKRSITCEISSSLRSTSKNNQENSNPTYSITRLPSTFESDVDSLIDSIHTELLESISLSSINKPYGEHHADTILQFSSSSNLLLSNSISNVINEELKPILINANANHTVCTQLYSEKEKQLTALKNELDQLRSIFKSGCSKLYDQLNRRSIMIDFKDQEEMKDQQNLRLKLNKIQFMNRELGLKLNKIQEEKRKNTRDLKSLLQKKLYLLDGNYYHEQNEFFMKKVIDEIDHIVEEMRNNDNSSKVADNHNKSSDELSQTDLFDVLTVAENIMQFNEEKSRDEFMETISLNRMLKYHLYRIMAIDSRGKNSSYSGFGSNSQMRLNYSPSRASNSQYQTSIILDN